MGRRQTIAAAISSLFLIGWAGAASAESANNPAYTMGLQPTHHSFFWDQKGRWSLKLDLSQPVGRGIEGRDVQAGAYYHVTPSLRVGGTVSLGDETTPIDHSDLPQTQAPRVKLETSFKF